MYQDKIRRVNEAIHKIDMVIEMEDCPEFKHQQTDKQLLMLQEDIIIEFEESIKSIREAIVNEKKYVNDSNKNNYIQNLKRIRIKLKSYLEELIFEEEKMKDLKTQIPSINITNTNNNNNTNNNDNINNNDNTNTNMKILFDEVRRKIEKDEYMQEEEIEDVLEKINEIEKISNLEEPNNKKWFKLRPTMEWLGTKGLTTATAILSLITAVLKMK